MTLNNDTIRRGANAGAAPGRRGFLIWMTTAILGYGVLSGLAILALPFGEFAQYSVIVHSVVGLLSLGPVCWLIYRHWRRSNGQLSHAVKRVAFVATLLLLIAILSGVVMSYQAAFGVLVAPELRIVHLVIGLLFGAALLYHLVQVFLRQQNPLLTPNGAPRRRFVWTGSAVVALLFGITFLLAQATTDAPRFQPFADDYDWRFGEDRPFWPSQAGILDPPWQVRLRERFRRSLDDSQLAMYESALARQTLADGGPINAARTAIESLDFDHELRERLQQILGDAQADLARSGALRPETMTGSASCGDSGCHKDIYDEWLPSAHGFSATDILFRRVQKVLADSEDAAQIRLCAGCHDPAALLSGARDGKPYDDHSLVTYEGSSCVVCHSTVATDIGGNGGYTVQIPERYLFEQTESAVGRFLNYFLIRSYSYQHERSYDRPLYKTSEFCAACHKQTEMPGVRTSAGLAQEQNEYDSWKEGRWYHEEDEELRIECRECHMPLVDSSDPASGDEHDSNRTPDDGKHRSHRMLASNMYIPVVQNLVGGEEQAEKTIAWLRGEIEIPEIEHKWETGPVVEIEIEAPAEAVPGELLNLQLHLHNKKTGHQFPGGLLDILESWVELTVEDNLGNVLMQLGNERIVSPSLDAPVIYKADWYDSQGLPLDRHNLWDVVGESYRRALDSGGSDVIDVPFRCPGIMRPRLSESASQDGPGDRRSDVVFSVDNEEVTELHVTARLLFRKANPEFLNNIFDLDTVVEVPVVELNRASHTIRIVAEK